MLHPSRVAGIFTDFAFQQFVLRFVMQIKIYSPKPAGKLRTKQLFSAGEICFNLLSLVNTALHVTAAIRLIAFMLYQM